GRRVGPAAAPVEHPPRAQDVAAVEEADRDQVDQVEEEADVGEREQEARVLRLAHGGHRPRADPAGDGPGERDERVPPRVEGHVLERDVGAEEGEEDGQRGVEALPLRLHVVAQLVHQDERDEPDRELPPPDQRVAADGDEDAEELEREGAELDRHPDHGGERRPDAHEHVSQRALAADGTVARIGIREGRRLERVVRPGRHVYTLRRAAHVALLAGSASLADPLLAAHVDLLLPQRHARLERVDRVLAGGERVRAVRGGDGDDDARLPHGHDAHAVVDGDLHEVVAALQLLGDGGHRLLRHALVRLVLEPYELARVVPTNVAMPPASSPATSRTAASTESGCWESRKAPPDTGGITATSSP